MVLYSFDVKAIKINLHVIHHSAHPTYTGHDWRTSGVKQGGCVRCVSGIFTRWPLGPLYLQREVQWSKFQYTMTRTRLCSLNLYDKLCQYVMQIYAN